MYETMLSNVLAPFPRLAFQFGVTFSKFLIAVGCCENGILTSFREAPKGTLIELLLGANREVSLLDREGRW
jgi:hypothetical protein